MLPGTGDGRQATTKVRLLSAVASVIGSPPIALEKYMRQLHVWESPLLHGGLPTSPPKEVVYEENEYDWWNFNERGDLEIGVIEILATDEYGNAMEHWRRRRVIWIITRGMYAKVWEDDQLDEFIGDEEESSPVEITDEDLTENPTFAETALSPAFTTSTGTLYHSDNAEDVGGARILELPSLTAHSDLEIISDETPRRRFAGNATLYLPQQDQPSDLDEVPLPDTPEFEESTQDRPDLEPEPEPETPKESDEQSAGFLLTPTLGLPLASSKQE